MSEEKYKIDSVHGFEARYKQIGGLQCGIPKGVRIEDIENEIIIISFGGRSQLQNKEIAMSLLTAQAENKRLREALIEIAKTEPSPLFSYSSKDIDKICIIAKQALGGQHATKTNMAE